MLQQVVDPTSHWDNLYPMNSLIEACGGIPRFINSDPSSDWEYSLNESFELELDLSLGWSPLAVTSSIYNDICITREGESLFPLVKITDNTNILNIYSINSKEPIKDSNYEEHFLCLSKDKGKTWLCSTPEKQKN